MKKDKPSRVGRYIVNHTKKEYVDKKECPKDKDGWIIHPLPLLTAQGNGQGGGDYYTEDDSELFIGTWAGDSLEVTSKKPQYMRKIRPNFIER